VPCWLDEDDGDLATMQRMSAWIEMRRAHEVGAVCDDWQTQLDNNRRLRRLCEILRDGRS